jgi:ATPase family associated with various cellular activities (AAA)/Winged helix domain, variant
MPTDPTAAFRPLDDALARARALIEGAIRRRWDQGLITRDPDGVFTAFLGPEQIEKLMAGAALPPQPIVPHDYDPRTPLGEMVARLDLTETEADLLALLFALETDPASARLVTYLGGNQQQFALNVDLAFEIVYRGRAPAHALAAAVLHEDLAPHGRLRRLRFLVIDGADSRVALAQGVRLHPRLVLWLVGQRGLDPDLTAVAELYPPTDPRGECEAKALDVVTAAFRASGRLLLVDGPAQSGRVMLLRFAAARLGRPLLVVEGRGLGPDRLVSAFREATLHSALLAFHETEELLLGEGLERLRDCLYVVDDTIALIGVQKATPTVVRLRPVSAVAVKVPPLGERLRLWRTYLGENTDLSDDEMRQTASLYNLGVGGIIAASDAARESATFAGVSLARTHVTRAVRQLFDADLSRVATRVEVSQTWDDLVIPEDLRESVEGIIDRVRLRSDVLGGWGFARKLGKGLGLTVLFSGEPGTGKSMVAGLLAAELGLDLYVVDLSQVTSKWLGETEKNLGRAFDAAEAGHVLLLFDEADSILGKRSSDIRSSNDRHANLETNFILARIEQFQGIALFTTNLPSAIDPAVSRRMSVHVNFPFPDVTARVDLWHRMLPAEVPLAEDIDFEQLADRYELSGGFIRNIVLRAAYASARDGVPIDMAHLVRAAELEYRERGSLLVGGRLA